jgi:hypothetical protein
MITITEDGVLVMAHSCAAVCISDAVVSAQTAPAQCESSVSSLTFTRT